MTLRDFLKKSNRYLLRSNLFIWNQFEVSFGAYEDRSGTLSITLPEGISRDLGKGVKTWFVMDDESIVFDDSYCLEKNEFTIWNQNRLGTGAVDNNGNLVFVKDGFMVRMYPEGKEDKLTEAPEGACDVSIQEDTIYLNRPYKDTEYTYLEAYDYEGRKNEEETAEILESTEPQILYDLKKDKIEASLKEESDYKYESVWNVITDVLLFHREDFINASPNHSTLNKYYEKISDYIKYLFLKQHIPKHHTEAGNLFAYKIYKGEDNLREYDYYSEYISPPHRRLPVPETDEDFYKTLKKHKETIDKVLRIVKKMGVDCSLETFDSIFNDPKLMESVFQFYGTIDTIEKYCRVQVGK